MGTNKGRRRGRSSREQNRKHTGTKHSGLKTQDYSKARSRWRLRYIFASGVAKAAIPLAVFIAGVIVGGIGLIPTILAQSPVPAANAPVDPDDSGSQISDPHWFVAWLNAINTKSILALAETVRLVSFEVGRAAIEITSTIFVLLALVGFVAFLAWQIKKHVLELCVYIRRGP